MYGIPQPYIKDKTRLSFPVYVPGETYSFVINSNIVIDDISFDDFSIAIYDVNGNYIDTYASVNRVFITSTVYQIYTNFVFPSLPNGYYTFRIINILYPLETWEIFQSNYIFVTSDPEIIARTCYVKFRHNDVLYGVRYDLLPEFYQMFRLPISQPKSFEIKSDREQNRDSSNGRLLRNSKSFRDIIIPLEYYFALEEELAALSAMLEHSDISINYEKVSCELTQIKIEKPTEFSKLGKANFEIIIDRVDIDYGALDHYGEFILWGLGFEGGVEDFYDGGGFS